MRCSPSRGSHLPVLQRLAREFHNPAGKHTAKDTHDLPGVYSLCASPSFISNKPLVERLLPGRPVGPSLVGTAHIGMPLHLGPFVSCGVSRFPALSHSVSRHFLSGPFFLYSHDSLPALLCLQSAQHQATALILMSVSNPPG